MPHAFLLLLKHIVTITLFLLDRLTVLLLLANSHRTVPSERPTPKHSFFYYILIWEINIKTLNHFWGLDMT